MKKIVLVLFSIFVLVPQFALAITTEDRRMINLDAVYFGGTTSTQRLCGTKDTDQYPILLPEITDSEALADAINKYIENRQSDSPFVDMGRYFVEGGIRAGINPVFVVALAVKESALGTTGTPIPAHNAFGRTASSSQPSYQPAGRAWYAWESWEESLYSKSFPASGSVGDPDDMFQYIARRFSGNLESGLFLFLGGGNDVSGYAPTSDGNDVPAYVDLVVRVTEDIAELAGGAIDLSRISLSGESCVGVGNDVVATALFYSWPKYRSPNSPNSNQQKPEYAQAHKEAVARGEYPGGCGGNDCGAFVTRVMRDSGWDPNYNFGNGPTPTQRTYLELNWEVVSVSSTADLQPGDVAMRPGHTFMFVGNQPGFETSIASASYSSGGASGPSATPNSPGCSRSRAPMAGRENIFDSRVTWYRNAGG